MIAGLHKGRTLHAVPGQNTRPTSDKAKEALFNMIGPYFSGGICLDLFAGTGSLGIEAISRGMERCIFIDRDYTAIRTIQTNVKNLNISKQCEIYKVDAKRALRILAKKSYKFDVVFVDPPYKKMQGGLILNELIEGGLLNLDCIVVMEHDKEGSMDKFSAHVFKWKQKEVGDTIFTIFKYQQ